ncbi:signal peptidase I [Oscillochloris sp. ZM17-4]|uniref:signal peptidase I n=1 Tax=Oscillochloris sp. ZM17-4 TaxID=2866714 RepID=UPI001C72B0DE|nr:signal peptidase I [Oscillochloris sp. ZM17-4]MBX0327663.1 signal peptidase I [Oscillochloris sp. ZM17-4]
MGTRLAIPTQLMTALLLGALFGAWLLFAPMQLGGQAGFVIVNGNSMEPLYHKGDLVIIRAEPSYGVGDIVTYQHPEIGPVIHRIIGRDGERWVFRGDHNDFIDPYHPLTSELMGRSWIFVPSVGKLLVWVRQSPLLLALALGGWVMMMMLSPQSKEGKGRRRKGGPPADQPTGSGGGTREWALSLLGVLAMVSLALAAFAFTKPTSQDITDSLAYTQQGSFHYAADAPAGLYDTDSVQSGEPIFLQLSQKMSVAFDYQLASDLPADLRGRYDMVAAVSTQSGWNRTLTLAEPQPFSGGKLSAYGMIELSQISAMIAQFEAQTGLQHQQYILSITPRISIEGALGGEPLHDSFAPKMEFRLNEVQLQLIVGDAGKDLLQPAQEGALKRTRSEPSTISPLGLTLDVSLARQAGLIAAAISLGLAAIVGLPLLRAGGQGEQARIQMRYGAQIVDLAGPPDMRAARLVQIGSIEGLAKLAERHGALILRDRSTQPARYIVQDGAVAYVYGEVAPEAAAPPAQPDPAVPEGQSPAEQAWQDRFLQALRESGLAAEACHSVGIDMVTAYRERERSTEFAQAWNDARLTAWQRHTLRGQAQ